MAKKCLLGGAAVLPAQLQPFNTPLAPDVKALYVAMIDRAIQDVCNTKLQDETTRQDALAWVESTATGPTSFDSVCFGLGLNRGATTATIVRMYRENRVVRRRELRKRVLK